MVEADTWVVAVREQTRKVCQAASGDSGVLILMAMSYLALCRTSNISNTHSACYHPLVASSLVFTVPTGTLTRGVDTDGICNECV